MKCAKPGCAAEAMHGGNYCAGHQPSESGVVAKRMDRMAERDSRWVTTDGKKNDKKEKK